MCDLDQIWIQHHQNHAYTYMRGSRGRGSDEGSRGPDPNPEQKSADTIEYIENKCDKLIKYTFVKCNFLKL